MSKAGVLHPGLSCWKGRAAVSAGAENAFPPPERRRTVGVTEEQLRELGLTLRKHRPEGSS